MSVEEEIKELSPAASQLRFRFDSFANVVTGIGSSADKRIGGFARVDYLDYQQCSDLYRGNDMAARIIDSTPDEMCRRGWEIAIQNQDDKGGLQGRDASERVAHYVDDLDERKGFLQALKWMRAFGGAGIFVGAHDGQTADLPLDYTKIQRIDFMLPLDNMELIANTYYTDPLQPMYGLPETYRMNRIGMGGSPTYPSKSGGKNQNIMDKFFSIFNLFGTDKVTDLRSGQFTYLPIVHESRILRFDGIIISRLQLRENKYWGDSELIRCNEVLRDFNLSWSSASILLQDFAQAVIKLPGFAALLAKEGPIAFQQAAQMVESSRSTARALFLDKDDEFERKSTPTTGLPELLGQFARRLAAAADMPMSRLMGDSPRGFNASGETDETWWYDKIAAKQRVSLLPPLKRWYKMVFAAKEGPTKGITPENWKIIFKPLKQLSDLQEADRRFRIAQADAVQVGAGIYTAEEVALTRAGGDEYNGGKIELLEEDASTREKNRVELTLKMAPPKAGAIGAASTNPGFDKRKVEVHTGAAGSDLPAVTGGNNRAGDSADPTPVVNTTVINNDSAEKIATAIALALAPLLKQSSRENSEVEVKRDAKGQILKLQLVSTKKE